MTARRSATLAALVTVLGCAFDPDGPGGASGGDGAPPADAPAGSDDAGRDIDGAAPGDAGTPDATPVLDGDEDGVPDGIDNCPAIPNVDQSDEESDTVGDACDNCPVAVNPDQQNGGEIGVGQPVDGVGDACDPRPFQGGDTIALFDGFNAADPGWLVGEGEFTWSVTGGRMRQTDPAGPTDESKVLYFDALTLADVLVETQVQLDALSTTMATDFRTFGLVAAFEETGSSDEGYACLQLLNDGDESLITLDIQDDSPIDITDITYNINPGEMYRMWMAVDAPATEQMCATQQIKDGQFSIGESSDDVHSEGHVGLQTFQSAVSFDYVLVYGLGGPLGGFTP
jgi:hypothetical protein